MMTRPLFLSLFAACTFLPGRAQETRRMSQDLSDVTVRARRLSLENLLDSVIRHAPASYAEPPFLAVVEKTRLFKAGDTLFKADVPAYLTKNKSYTYELRRDTTEKALVEDRLPADRHHRILNFVSYPVGTNLLTMLERRASGSVSRKGYYATSGWGDSLRYHVLVPRKFRRDWLTKMVTTKMDDDTIMAFYKLTILRKGWVLEESVYKATTARRELVSAFWKTRSYNSADSLMNVARTDEAARKTYSIKRWSAGEDGRYRFGHYHAIDNLMFFSGDLFSQKDKMTDYSFSYELQADERRRPAGREGLVPFGISDFFNRDAAGKKPSSGLVVTDTY